MPKARELQARSSPNYYYSRPAIKWGHANNKIINSVDSDKNVSERFFLVSDQPFVLPQLDIFVIERKGFLSQPAKVFHKIYEGDTFWAELFWRNWRNFQEPLEGLRKETEKCQIAYSSFTDRTRLTHKCIIQTAYIGSCATLRLQQHSATGSYSLLNQIDQVVLKEILLAAF